MKETINLKNFSGKKSKTLDIVSSDSALGCLKKFNDNLKLCLPLQLSYGDLNEVSDFSRMSLKRLYKEEEYIPFENGYNFNKEIESLEKSIDDIDLIRIWTSHLNCDEYCLLLYLCSIIKNKKISVIFSEEYDDNCLSIGMINYTKIPELIKKEHLLSKNDIDCYTAEWKRLIKENSELRYIDNGKILSVPIDYFDEEILNILREIGEVTIYNLIGNLISHQIINDSSTSLYKYIINRLISSEKIIKSYNNGEYYVKINE